MHGNDFTIKHMFNKALKLLKEFKNFRLATQKIKSSELAIIINQTRVVFLVPRRINSRCQTSENTSSKGAID
jgi:hypothetical protein